MQANAKHAQTGTDNPTTAKRFVFPVFPGNTKTPPLKQHAKNARPIGFPIKPIKPHANNVVKPKEQTKAIHLAASARPACT